MPSEPIRLVRGRALVLALENIDTDQIVPARFLNTVDKSGLARACFHDWRFDAEGAPRPEGPLAGVDPESPKVIIGGRNFGCGSSREHAPWALLQYGVRAVLAPDIADIFRSNALKNGLIAADIAEAAWARLKASPGAELEVDIEAEEVRLAGAPVASFKLERFARHCLLEGLDPLGFLLAREAEIAAFEARRA